MTEHKNNQISTPNIRKSKTLGIRNTGKYKNNAFKTPLSETKVNIVSSNKSDSPITPLSNYNLAINQPNNESKSTGSLPLYKFSMNKRYRANLKKKKLEFSKEDKDLWNCSTDTITSELKLRPIGVTTGNNTSDSEYFGKSASQEEHDHKVAELKHTIDVWRNAFRTSLNDLSNKINKDKIVILQTLQISPDLIKLT